MLLRWLRFGLQIARFHFAVVVLLGCCHADELAVLFSIHAVPQLQHADALVADQAAMAAASQEHLASEQ